MRQFAPLTAGVGACLLCYLTLLGLFGVLAALLAPASPGLAPGMPMAAALATNLVLLLATWQQRSLARSRPVTRRLARALPRPLARTVILLSACLMVRLVCGPFA